MLRFFLSTALIVFAANIFSLSIRAQSVAAASTNAAASYARFAIENVGDAERGREVFANVQGAACLRCHTADASGGRVGPDLFAIADKFSRADIIRSILEPSAVIDVGYDTTVIETRDDEEYSGVVKQATDAAVDLMGWDGKLFHVPTASIRSRGTTTNSFMPAGLQKSLSLQNFDDLIEYLETLHQPTNSEAGGMPDHIPQAAHSVALKTFFGSELHFEHPVWFGEVPGFTNRFVVLEHAGKSWLIDRTAAGDKKSTFINLSGTVRFGGATGLLGLAFHPKFSENHKYYLQYQIETNGTIFTLLVERKFAADFSGDSGEPGRETLRIRAVTQDHNGGGIEFGPDGYLYLGMGDTGPQRDPQGHGQDLSLMLGKMLRLDVDHPSNGRAYGIPSDNPFINDTNILPEIWAYGLREPWRYTFDPASGDLWVGDVGQDKYEEVSIVRAGENQGWNVYEGFTPFSDQYRRPTEKYIPPVFSYPHRIGVCVTGGYVYRGRNAPAMFGRYIFGDFQVRHLWALTQRDRKLTSIIQIGDAPTRFAAFGRDHDGELYLVGYDDGIIYKLDLSVIVPTPL
jgi:putative heme-binding domain-containing protein